MAERAAIPVAVILALLVSGSAVGDVGVYWEDGDGGCGTNSSAVWNDIQTAITNAQKGASTRGTVKLSGDFVRNPTTDGNCLYVTNTAGGPITISGGWDSGFTAQQWKSVWNSTHDMTLEIGCYSVLDANADASHHARAIRIDCSNVRVEGCVIKNGYCPNVDPSPCNPTDLSSRGAGICAAANGATGLLLSHLVVTNNYTTGNYGGGLYLESVSDTSPVTVEYCQFANNIAGPPNFNGGAIFKSSGRRINVMNSIFTGNSAGQGHALYFGGETRATIFGCLFCTNGYSGSTRGVIDGSSTWNVNLMNCTIADNLGYGAYVGYADWPHNSQYRNCIFANNSAGAIALRNSTRTTPFTDGINRAAIVGRLILNDSAITNYTGSETYWDEGGMQLNTNPMFKKAAAHRYQPQAGSPAIDAGGPTNVAWQGQGVDSTGYLRVMSSAEKTAYLGAGAADCTIRYVNVLTYAENGAGSPPKAGAPNAGYDAEIDVIVDLGGYAPTEQNGLDNLIYPYDLAGNRRVRLETIDIGAYEFQPAKGTVVLIK